MIFNSLGKEHIFQIIDITLQDVRTRLEVLGYKLKLEDSAKDFLADKGYDPQFGARPLHRAIQKYLEDPLAEQILSGKFKAGDTLQVELDTEKNELVINPAGPKKKDKKEEKEKEEKEKEV